MILVPFIWLPLSVFASTITDPCASLCEAFSSDGRGRGFDLCEGGTSHCMESPSEFCAHLFWALTDTGDRGLVFGNEIFADEVVGQVSCLEAETIVNIHFNPLAHVGLAIVSNFGFFLRSQNGNDSIPFRDEITRGGPFRYSTVSRIHRSRPRGGASPTMENEIYELATLFGIRMVPEIFRYRRCLDCGTMIAQQSNERMYLDARENTTLVDLMNFQFGISRLVIGFCPYCRVRGEIAVRNSLSDPPGEIILIRINSVEESTVIIPEALDLSPFVYPSASPGSYMYRLVAQTYTGITARADIKIDERWYRVNATHSSLIGDMEISDYDWLFYERDSLS